METVRKTGSRERQDLETSRLSHVPSHIHDAPDSKQRGREGRARVVASREQPHHARFVRTGGDAGKTTGAEQGCEDGAGQEAGSCLIPGPKLDQKARKPTAFRVRLF